MPEQLRARTHFQSSATARARARGWLYHRPMALMTQLGSTRGEVRR